ncbi:MAG: hypothetical protein QMD71_08360 [bacterium]|nr:hypothetical protein [bacterium]
MYKVIIRLVGVVILLTAYSLFAEVMPNDPYFQSGDQWGLYNFDSPGHDIHAPDAWTIQQGRLDVKVAVIADGSDFYHPDLPGDELSWYNLPIMSWGTPPRAGIIGALTNNNTGQNRGTEPDFFLDSTGSFDITLLCRGLQGP